MNLRQQILLLADREGIEVTRVLPFVKLALSEVESRHFNDYGTESGAMDVWDNIKYAR